MNFVPPIVPRSGTASLEKNSLTLRRTRIAILGAGNMGTAMAHALAGNGHEVALWDFFPEVVEAIQQNRENRRFLPGIALHEAIRGTASMSDCVNGASLVVIGVPSPFVAETLGAALPAMAKNAVLLNLAKGFVLGTRQLLPLALAHQALGHSCVHLAGPAIANELVRGLPASILLASEDDRAVRRVARWLAGPAFITTTTSDVTGAALGGILKNVYAILLGALESLSGNQRNLEAAALTASVHEMATIAQAHGGRTATLHGLAGLGDLVATGFSRDSHNRRFGQSLAAGKTVAELEAEKGWLPEGARAAAAVCTLARAGKVHAPLAALVRHWIGGEPPYLDDLIHVLRSVRATDS
jgi:glycerol-3-phosphate dehydrogenase (NAD(P)+)